MRRHFLIPRLVLDELVLLNRLAGSDGLTQEHDPVCGLVLDPDRDSPALEEDGIRYAFCSDDCRRAFVTRHPAPSERADVKRRRQDERSS